MQFKMLEGPHLVQSFGALKSIIECGRLYLRPNLSKLSIDPLEKIEIGKIKFITFRFIKSLVGSLTREFEKQIYLTDTVSML